MKVIYRKNELIKPLILQSIPQYQALKTLINNSFKLAKKQWQLRVYDQNQNQQYLVESNQDYEGNVEDYKDRKIKNPLLVYVDTEQNDSFEISSIRKGNAQGDKESQEQFVSSGQEENTQKPKEQTKIQKQQEKEKGQPLRDQEEQQSRQSGQVEVYTEPVNEIKQEVEHHPNQPQKDRPNASEPSDASYIEGGSNTSSVHQIKKQVEQHPNQPQQNSSYISESSDASHIEEGSNTKSVHQIKKQTQIVINHHPTIQSYQNKQQPQPEIQQSKKEQAIKTIIHIDKRQEQNRSQHAQDQILGEAEEGEGQGEQERQEEVEVKEEGEVEVKAEAEVKGRGEKEVQKQLQREEEIQIQREISIQRESESERWKQREREISRYLENNNENKKQQIYQQYKYQQIVKKEQFKTAFSCSFCRQRDPNLHILTGFSDIRSCQNCQQSWLIQSKKRKVGAKVRQYSNKKNEFNEDCSFCGERYEAMFKVGLFDIRSCIGCRQKWEIVPVYEIHLA